MANRLGWHSDPVNRTLSGVRILVQTRIHENDLIFSRVDAKGNHVPFIEIRNVRVL